MEALRQLAVLGIRFQRMYWKEDEIDWTQRLWTDVDFFEHISTIPIMDLADLLTENDLTELYLVPPKEIIDTQGCGLQHVQRRWNRRCEAVQESIIFENMLNHSVVCLARVSSMSSLLRSKPTDIYNRNCTKDGISIHCFQYFKL